MQDGSVFSHASFTSSGSHDHDIVGNDEDSSTAAIEIFKIPSSREVLSATPIVTCSFICHFNVIAIQNSLSQPSRKRIQRLIQCSVEACFLLMYVFGLGG